MCQALGFSNYEGEYDTGCLQTLNASSAIYQDFSPSNAVSRQYMWLMCNEPWVFVLPLAGVVSH